MHAKAQTQPFRRTIDETQREITTEAFENQSCLVLDIIIVTRYVDRIESLIIIAARVQQVGLHTQPHSDIPLVGDIHRPIKSELIHIARFPQFHLVCPVEQVRTERYIQWNSRRIDQCTQRDTFDSLRQVRTIE